MKSLRLLTTIIFVLGSVLSIAGGAVREKPESSDPTQTADVDVTPESFPCLSKMTRVRHFFVGNLLGNLEGTVAVAKSPTGGKYPVGTVLQLVPSEVMVKHKAGWNAATGDWEFFELGVSTEGTRILKRGTTEIVNRFGGNCFNCHKEARPEFDMVCESDHGCKPIPVTRVQIAGIQAADPRCPKTAAR